MYLINLPKIDLKWLQKALNKKDHREFCSLILVNNGKAYATNGCVLHIVDTLEDQEGLYTFDGIKTNVDIAHPLVKNTQRLLNNIDRDCELSLIPTNLRVYKLSDVIGVNRKYFENAVSVAGSVSIKTDLDKQKILISYIMGNTTRVALIMGYKL